MTINRPLQRKLFMQQGGEPSLEMMQPQQQMMMQPQQQMIVQPTPEESTQALFQQGEQIGQGILVANKRSSRLRTTNERYSWR